MPIIYSKRGRVAEILFAHPPVNAFDSAGWNSIPEMIHRAGADEDVRCVLIRAEGRGFCGGVDIKEMQAHPERITGLNRGNYLTFKAIRDLRDPGGVRLAQLRHRRRRRYCRRQRRADRS